MARPPDHPQLAAPISGVAASWAHRVLSEALPRAVDVLMLTGRAAQAAELRAAVAVLGDAARLYERWQGSASGSAEVLVAEAGPVSGHEVTTDVAAALLGVTPRRVRQLAACGGLAARRVGRCWLVDRSALELLRVVRRSA